MFALCWRAEYVMIPYAFSHPRQLPPTGILVTPLGRQVPPFRRQVPPLGPKWPPGRWGGLVVYAGLACRMPCDSLCFQPPAAAAPNWIPGDPPWVPGDPPWAPSGHQGDAEVFAPRCVTMQNTL